MYVSAFFADVLKSDIWTKFFASIPVHLQPLASVVRLCVLTLEVSRAREDGPRSTIFATCQSNLSSSRFTCIVVLMKPTVLPYQIWEQLQHSLFCCNADFWPVRRLGLSWNLKVLQWINLTEVSDIIVYIVKIMWWVGRGGSRGRVQGMRTPPPLRWPSVF